MRAFSTFVWAVLLTAFTAFGQVIRITQFPAAGAVTPISGTVTGLTNPGAFKVILYLQAGGNWWIKPFPGSSVTLSGTGAFTFNNWASYPAGDANFQSLQLYVVPAATAVVNALGGPLPQAVVSASVARGTYPRGYVPPATPVEPEEPATPPGGGDAPAIAITAFPARGTVTPISGQVTGLPNPANFKAVLYLQAGGTWWIKPQPGSSVTLSGTGTFTFPNWASYPPGDANFQSLQIFIVPAAAPVINALGAPLPAAMRTAAVATGNYPAGYTAPPPGTPQQPPVQPPVQPPTEPTPPPATGTPTLAITAFPARGTVTPITGSVTGLTNPANFKAILYLQAGGTWWIKPQPGSSVTLSNTGTFTFPNWASYPAGDANFQALQIYIVPAAVPVANVLGAALPAAIQTAAVASGNYPAGYTAGGPGGGTQPTPPPATTPTLVVNGFGGGTPAITGRVSGVANPAAHKALLYVNGGGAWWGAKPNLATVYPIGADGSFTLANWASDPNDANVNNFAIHIVPTATAAVAILGAAGFPASLTGASVVSAQFTRTGTAGGNPAPEQPQIPPGGGGGIDMAWPPATLGPRVGSAGGFINFAGYRWIVKNSNGGRVGPGNNIFDPGMNNIWVDNWGLHLNVVPSQGCTRWTASEVWIDRRLGYGTYLVRYAGAVDNLDPDVVWAPFFLWDDTGNAGNAWREIDFEVARWGNAGDATSSQFVLRPLQSGGMVPGWRYRYETRNNHRILSGQGQGGGGYNNPGADNFNGAAIYKTTCVLRWLQGHIAWYCADGHYTLDTFNQIPRERLLASYTYGYPQYVPDPGDNRVHINLWLQNGAQPRWGRRSHQVISGFEFRAADVRFPNLPNNANAFYRGYATDGDEAPVPPSMQSSGDPTLSGLQSTLTSAETVSGASFPDENPYANQPLGDGVRLLSSSSSSSSSAASGLSAPVIAGTLVAGLVAFAAVFAAGFTYARRRANQSYTPLAGSTQGILMRDEDTAGHKSRVAPTRSRGSSAGHQ